MDRNDQGGKIKTIVATLVLIAFFLIAARSACIEMPPQITTEKGQGCGWGLVSGNTAAGLGAADYNAGYVGVTAPMRPGERLVVRQKFPHSRYLSFNLYDQNFIPIDNLADDQIVPLEGQNPYHPGVDRSADDLGEYELEVRMEDPPAGERPPNTLYAGRAANGKKNKIAVLGYRVYLADRGYGYADDHPRAVYGGVEPGLVQFYHADGRAFCPNPVAARASALKVLGSILKANRDVLKNPRSISGAAQNPPIWLNNASKSESGDRTYVPNEETSYLATPITAEFGELLVLRFRLPRLPLETYEGKPFPPQYDLRYWGLTLCHLDLDRPLKLYSERTVADVKLAHLADGTAQIVIGFDNAPCPDFIPAEMYVALKRHEGSLVVRNIKPSPGYEGDLSRLPSGEIPPEFDRFTPGGVYCSIEELRQHPDLGLRREELLRK